MLSPDRLRRLARLFLFVLLTSVGTVLSLVITLIARHLYRDARGLRRPAARTRSRLEPLP